MIGWSNEYFGIKFTWTYVQINDSPDIQEFVQLNKKKLSSIDKVYGYLS